MNRRTKTILALGCALLATAVLGACTLNDDPYPDLHKAGNTVHVCYDTSGGQFRNKNDNIVDVYSYEDFARGIKLVAPGDSKRGGEAQYSRISKDGCTLIGWYLERGNRVDGGGEPLDDNGEKTSVSHRDQGYSYTGYWDFDNRISDPSLLEEKTDEKGNTYYELRLYAAWAPYYTFDIYMQTESGWSQYGLYTCPRCGTVYSEAEYAAMSASWTCPVEVAVEKTEEEEEEEGSGNSEEQEEETPETEPCGTKKSELLSKPSSFSQAVGEMDTPKWEQGKSSLQYGSFPGRTGYTLSAVYGDTEMTDVYADENMLHVVKDKITFDGTTRGVIDYETGTASNMHIPLYTTWRKGTWYRITTASQLSSIAADGCYEITCDLDLDKVIWPAGALTFTGVFAGAKADGTPAVLQNIHTDQISNSPLTGGVFGRIAAAARIENVIFENAELSISRATRQQGGLYGLLAGEIQQGATLTNVAISGTIRLGDLIDESRFENFVIGLISGNLVSGGVSNENIVVLTDKVRKMDDEQGILTDQYPVRTEIDRETGKVTVFKNEDPYNNPNPPTQENDNQQNTENGGN